MILAAPREEILHYNWGNTKNIVEVIMKVIDKDQLHVQVEKFAAQFKGANDQDQIDKLYQLWRWVRTTIPYDPDPVGLQAIKHPARTYEDALKGIGSDCKSMSVFIRFVLYCIGVPHYIEFASYNRNKRIQHVFAVAQVGDQDIPIDPVYKKFNQRVKATFTQKVNPKRMTKIVEIAGVHGPIVLPKRPRLPISQVTDGELKLLLTIRELELVEALNRQRGFLENADQQARVLYDLQNIQNRGLHAGFGFVKNQGVNDFVELLKRRDLPSFMASFAGLYGEYDPTIEQANYCRSAAANYANQQFYMRGIYHPNENSILPGTSSSWNDIYNTQLQECIDEVQMENVVNAHLIDAGPYFMYDQWGPSSNNYRVVIENKRLRQTDWIYTAAQVTGLAIDNIRGIARTGSIEHLASIEGSSYTPESLQTALSGTIYQRENVGDLITVLAIVTAVVGLVTKSVQLVKSFETQSKSKQAFRNIPPADSPSIKIEQSDFALPVDQEQGGTASGSSGGNGFLGLNMTQLALAFSGAMLLFNKTSE